MSIWEVLWLAWLAAFGVIEGVALVNDRRHGYATGQRTLSVNFRRWFRTDTHRGRTVWLLVSGIFFAWFTVHIAVAGSA